MIVPVGQRVASVFFEIIEDAFSFRQWTFLMSLRFTDAIWVGCWFWLLQVA